MPEVNTSGRDASVQANSG